MKEAQNTSDLILNFLVRKFPLARTRGVKESDPLLESGILDSMGVLELVEFVEHEFAIKISDDELVPENFQTIQQMASFVCRKRSPRRGQNGQGLPGMTREPNSRSNGVQ